MNRNPRRGKLKRLLKIHKDKKLLDGVVQRLFLCENKLSDVAFLALFWHNKVIIVFGLNYGSQHT